MKNCDSVKIVLMVMLSLCRSSTVIGEFTLQSPPDVYPVDIKEGE